MSVEKGRGLYRLQIREHISAQCAIELSSADTTPRNSIIILKVTLGLLNPIPLLTHTHATYFWSPNGLPTQPPHPEATQFSLKALPVDLSSIVWKCREKKIDSVDQIKVILKAAKLTHLQELTTSAWCSDQQGDLKNWS